MKELVVIMGMIFTLLVISISETSAQNQCVTNIEGTLVIGPGASGCQPGLGSLGVYDGTGLFLGYFISGQSGLYSIFNLDIGIVQVYADYPNPSLYPIGLNLAYFFKSDNCSGQAYSFSVGPQDLSFETTTGKYFIGDLQAPPAVTTDMHSISYHSVCSIFPPCPPDIFPPSVYCPVLYDGSLRTALFYPLKEVPIPPLFTHTLQNPILLKPVQ